ncbi:peptide transporter PTR2-A [Amniculicola lignicola CBS 123094]|uniref:Peptide transporter PTR2-A n=1 Tax=Amniculicola lignicola CBS 123094 TaxID=1392246 RepID=A0A6A5W7H4_9PLEO|nr:peptide transporter PTR2-A [Amniculicola lignicola CBS 123094]
MATVHDEYSGSGTSISRSTSEVPSDNPQPPTASEVEGLRRVVDHIPRRLWIVAVIGFFERASFWGITAPWQNYMQHAHEVDAAPGVLGLGQAMATRIYCAFYIFYYVTPVGFAIIADAHLGRFKTLCISSVLYVLGCGALLSTSSPGLIENEVALRGFIVALVLIGLGGGGFRALMVPFIADQYTDTRPKLKTLKSGEKVVTDRALTIQYIYNLYFWIGNVGSLSWFATTFLEMKYGFFQSYLLPSLSMVIATLLLMFGSRWYHKMPSEENALPAASKILWCAAKDGFKIEHADPAYQLENHAKRVPWGSHLVKELRHGVKACRVLVAFVIFYVCFDQMQNNLISQAGEMETRGVPNDLLPAMNQVACIVLGPLVQSVLYPFLRNRNINFKPITRITVGFGFISLAMLYAMIVQQVIYTTGPCYKHPGDCDEGSSLPNRVNVWIQAPVYVFIATGELFAYVTALEYAYDHAPKDMKTIVQAISLLIAGLGSACAMGLTPVAHDPNLVIVYACLASAMAFTAGVFWWRFRKYNKHDTPYPEEEMIPIIENAKAELSPISEDHSISDYDRITVPSPSPNLPTASDYSSSNYSGCEASSRPDTGK